MFANFYFLGLSKCIKEIFVCTGRRNKSNYRVPIERPSKSGNNEKRREDAFRGFTRPRRHRALAKNHGFGPIHRVSAVQTV